MAFTKSACDERPTMTLETLHPALKSGGVAVITGGAGGIGLAVGLRLAKAGMRVCLADRQADLLAEAVASFNGVGEVVGQVTDVSDPASVAALARFVEAELGPVSVLMNNAGVGGGGDALSNPGGWARILGVNLMGVLHGVQRFVPAMVTSGQPGLVVNTGSKQGITQPPGDTAYNVSKSGVKALTEGLAHTLRNTEGCRVSAHLLIPGFTYTGMTSRHFSSLPPGAWTPDQVAERLLEGIAARDFYVLCQDNETTRLQDERRISWSAEDPIHNRPALSRWHPDYKEAFAKYMAGDA